MTLIWFVGFAVTVLPPISAASGRLNLLPTSTVKHSVDDIHIKLKNQELKLPERAVYFNQLKGRISRFIAAQLEAEPRLEPEQLRRQIIRILGNENQDLASSCGKAPYVQRGGSGPLLWAVIYGDQLYEGLGGARTVIESYVVDQGKASLRGRGGLELDGVDLNGERIWNPKPNSLAFLLHGIYTWTSGRVLPGKAVLYGIDATGVRPIWQMPRTGGLKAFGHPDAEGFTITYLDEERDSRGLPKASIIEVYLLRPGGLDRIVKQYYETFK